MFRTYTDVTRPPLVDQQAPTFNNRVYICDFCSEGWSSETEVEIHRSNCHSNVINDMMKQQERHICKMCITEFPQYNNLLQHIKVEHLLSSEDATRVERDIFICSDCGDIFFNKLLLSHHILITHKRNTQNKVFKCPRCFKNIRIKTYWYHFLRHKLQSIAVCKICLTKFKDRLTLAEHMEHHPPIYRCDTCIFATRFKETFMQHIQNVHKKPGAHREAFNDKWMKYYVPKRQPKSWQRINLMGWKGVRLTNNIHICVLCREICDSVASMKRHILVDHCMGDRKEIEGSPVGETTKPNHRCSCGMEFTTKVLYRHHLFKFRKEHES